MILCLKIALIALLSSITVEGYGPRYSHRHRSSRGREHFPLVSLGRNGPRRDSRSHGMHGHFNFYRYPYYRRTTILEELSRRWPYSEESSELDSGYSSEDDLNDFDSPEIEYTDLYLPKRPPCWPWRCPTQEKNEGHHASWTRPSSSRKTTLEVSSMTATKRWDSIPMLETSAYEQSSREAVTTPMSILDITMPPEPKFILGRIAPVEDVPVLVTTVTPETSQHKMSSPETSQTTMGSPEISQTTMSSPETTTISQAVLDCIDNCISTPEFNPVCGTNDETYGNIGKLFCAKTCGVDVELRRMSRCFPVLPFIDDYDDYDNNNNNSNDGENERRNNNGEEGSGNDYDEENENGSDQLPPTNFEKSPAHGDLPFNSLRNESSSSSDGETSPSTGDEPLNSLSSEPSSSPLDDLSPSSRAKSLSLNDETSSSLSSRGNGIITTGSNSFVNSPTTPSAPRFRRTTHLSDLQKCMKLCPITIDYYPICGTDLVTYINIDRIECARGCGLDVQILCEQPCHLCNVGSRTPASSMNRPLITASSTTTSTTSTIPITLQVATNTKNIVNANSMMLKEQCVTACPVTPEYNPVCGTNNVTYMNPVHLLCVQMCGDAVKIAKFGSCPIESRIETLIASTVAEEEEITLSPEILACTKRCVVTSEYNPVCGTNEETYTNLGKLECAKFCGIDVKLSYKGLCNGFFFSEFTSSNTTGDSGIGGQATASWEILRSTPLSTRLPLRTSKLTSVETIPQTTTPIAQATESTTPSFLPLAYSPPTSTTFSSIPSTTASNPITTTTESENSTSFTFAPEVLISIFGYAALETTTDMSTKDDEIRIDPRSGNEDYNRPNPSVKLDPNRIVFPE